MLYFLTDFTNKATFFTKIPFSLRLNNVKDSTFCFSTAPPLSIVHSIVNSCTIMIFFSSVDKREHIWFGFNTIHHGAISFAKIPPTFFNSLIWKENLVVVGVGRIPRNLLHHKSNNLKSNWKLSNKSKYMFISLTFS